MTMQRYDFFLNYQNFHQLFFKKTTKKSLFSNNKKINTLFCYLHIAKSYLKPQFSTLKHNVKTFYFTYISKVYYID